MREFALNVGVGVLAGGAAAFCAGAYWQQQQQQRQKQQQQKKQDKRTPKGCFVLDIRITFETEADLETFCEIWRPTADYCIGHEPNLLAYKINRSDKDPKQIMIFERFLTRDDYVGPHRSSDSFFAFKDKLTQAGLKYQMDGHSYYETDLGFMERT